MSDLLVGPARLAESIRLHPRHLVLAALVAGMLLAPAAAGRALAAAALATAAVGGLAGRWALGAVAAVAVLAGSLLVHARLAALDRTELGPLLGATVVARAVLLEQPHRVRYGATALAELRAISPATASAPPAMAGAAAAAPAPLGGAPTARALGRTGAGERVMLRITTHVSWPRVATGAIVVVSGRLRRLGPFERHYARRGAHAAITLSAVAPTGETRGGPWRLVDVIRTRAEAPLDVGLAPPQRALLRGMALGQDQGLSDRTRDDFRASGLSHLTAASGQNVALLAALALPLLAAAGAGLRGRLVGVLVLIALYVPLAGAGPSIQRAGVMGAATTVAALAGRPAARWYALLLAAAVTLAANPRTSGDPGWQLSFAAVAAIALIAAPLSDALRRRRVPAGPAQACAITVAATVGTAPLLAFHFSEVSVVSLVANVVAEPVVAPIMWLGLLAAAVGQIAAPLALPLNLVNASLLGFVGAVAHAAAATPHAVVAVRLRDPRVLAAVYGALALGALALRRRIGGAGRHPDSPRD